MEKKTSKNSKKNSNKFQKNSEKFPWNSDEADQWLTNRPLQQSFLNKRKKSKTIVRFTEIKC